MSHFECKKQCSDMIVAIRHCGTFFFPCGMCSRDTCLFDCQFRAGHQESIYQRATCFECYKKAKTKWMWQSRLYIPIYKRLVWLMYAGESKYGTCLCCQESVDFFASAVSFGNGGPVDVSDTKNLRLSCIACFSTNFDLQCANADNIRGFKIDRTPFMSESDARMKLDNYQ
jgi:hypothetical protein